MAATLAGTNLSVDSTNSYEAVTLSTSSTTLTDNAILALKKTSTPTGTAPNNYVGAVQSWAKAQNGAYNYSYDLQFKSASTSTTTYLNIGTLLLTGYATNSGNTPVAQLQLQHNQSTFRVVDLGVGSGGNMFSVSQTAIGPSTGYDNVQTCGQSASRYSVVYAATGTINTSDFNAKEQIESLSDAELRVASAIKGLFKKFKWKDAVAKKGDGARIHVGVIAQEVEAAFVTEGLDPERYAIFCKDVWWEKMIPNPDYVTFWFKEVPNPDWVEGGSEPETIMARFSEPVEGGTEAPQGKPEILEHFSEEVEGGVRKERKGIRYDQLLAFVIAAM